MGNLNDFPCKVMVSDKRKLNKVRAKHRSWAPDEWEVAPLEYLREDNLWRQKSQARQDFRKLLSFSVDEGTWE